jgi:hypothetical protein
MRLSLSVNDRPVARPSLESNGWLSAHVNLSQGVEAEEVPNRVWAVAYDRSEEPNSITSTWDGIALAVGDKVEITVLPDGESDPPSSVSRTTEATTNLFSNVEQARFLLNAVKVCDTELWGVLTRAQEKEPPDELAKIQRAVGEILAEFDRLLISPTLRQHPELLVEAQEKNLR